jgi:hypothetical protein
MAPKHGKCQAKKTRGKGKLNLANASISVEEIQTIGVHPSDTSKFLCKLCEAPCNEFAKAKSFQHLIGHSELNPTELKSWVVVKDGYKVANHTEHLMRLETLMPNIEGCEDTHSTSISVVDGEHNHQVSEQACDDMHQCHANHCPTSIGLVQIASFLSQHPLPHGLDSASCFFAAELLIMEAAKLTSLHSSQSVDMTQPHAPHISTSVQSGSPAVIKLQCPGGVVEVVANEVPTPDLTVAGWVHEWKHPRELGVHKQRYDPPHKPCTDELIAFKEFLEGCGTNTSTIKSFVADMRRLFGMFAYTDDPAKPYSWLGIMLASYKQGAMHALLATDLMAPHHHWARHTRHALSWFIKWISNECMQYELDYEKGRLDTLVAVVINQKKKMVNAAKKQSDLALNRHHANIIREVQKDQGFRSRVKESILDAMYHLKYVCGMCTDKGYVDARSRHLINICLAFLIYFNSFGGRPGEWKSMLSAAVWTMLNGSLDYIECPEHKTAMVYGSLGKHCPDGTKEGFKHVLCLPADSPPSHLLLTTHGTPGVNISKCLKCACDVFFNGKYTMTPTIARKYFHVESVNVAKRDEVLRMLKRVDAHTEAVAEGVYCCNHPETDAMYGSFLYEAVLGKPVGWPSELPHDFRLKHLHKFEVPANGAEDDEDAEDLGGDDTEFMIKLPLNLFMAIQDAPPAAAAPDMMDSDDMLAIQDAPNCAHAQERKRLKRGRQSAFSEAEQSWILVECAKFLDIPQLVPGGSVPPNACLRHIIWHGTSANGPLAHVLSSYNASQQLDKVRGVAQAAVRVVDK